MELINVDDFDFTNWRPTPKAAARASAWTGASRPARWPERTDGFPSRSGS
jgi:hypothetical protein